MAFVKANRIKDSVLIKNAFLRGPSPRTLKSGKLEYSWTGGDKNPMLQASSSDPKWGKCVFTMKPHEKLLEESAKLRMGQIFKEYFKGGRWDQLWKLSREVAEEEPFIFEQLEVQHNDPKKGPQWLGWCSWSIQVTSDADIDSDDAEVTSLVGPFKGVRYLLVDVGSSIKGNDGFYVYKFELEADLGDKEVVSKLGASGGPQDYSKFEDLLSYIKSNCVPSSEFYRDSGKVPIPYY